jgi:hypothetical protein
MLVGDERSHDVVVVVVVVVVAAVLVMWYSLRLLHYRCGCCIFI